MSKPTKIIIPLVGITSGQQKPRAIYDAVSSQILNAIGTVETARASNVECGKDLSQAALACLGEEYRETVEGLLRIRPLYSNQWFADMTPTGHLTVLGPWPHHSRDAALATEVEWLENHNVPVCQPCRKALEEAREVKTESEDTVRLLRDQVAQAQYESQFAGRTVVDYSPWEKRGDCYSIQAALEPTSEFDTEPEQRKLEITFLPRSSEIRDVRLL